jgi:hypothetical protein
MTEGAVKTQTSRREHVRLKLTEDVRAMIRIVNVDGEWVRSNASEVLMLDISPGGCGFYCQLLFPIDFKVLLELEWLTGNEKLSFIGQVVWREELENGFRYGMYFRLNPYERIQLNRVLNQLLLRKCPGQDWIHKQYRSHSHFQGAHG